MARFLLVHGAWSSAFAWQNFRKRMISAGHEFITPSLTGLGERSHLSGPDVSLDTHIADIEQVLFNEDLNDVTLLAHSYGGMVATGVLDRAPERISRIIYLDAAVPENGRSLLDYMEAGARQKLLDYVAENGDGWKVPPNPMPADTPADQLDWLMARRKPQPLKAFSTPVRLNRPMPDIPHSYIYCTIPGPGDLFRQFRDRLSTEQRWNVHDIDASHNPHITCPGVLEALLNRIVG